MVKLRHLPDRVNFGSYDFHKGMYSSSTLAYKQPGKFYPHITIVGNADSPFRDFHITASLTLTKPDGTTYPVQVRFYYSYTINSTGKIKVNTSGWLAKPHPTAGIHYDDRAKETVRIWAESKTAAARQLAFGFVQKLSESVNLSESESEAEDSFAEHKTPDRLSLAWRGLTLDNHPLQLTDLGLKRIISRLPTQPSLKNFVKSNYEGNLDRAVVRSFSQIARDALYAGSVSHPKFSRKLRVFNAPDIGGVKYQILAFPVSDTESAIVGIEMKSRNEAEMEHTREEIALMTKEQAKNLSAKEKTIWRSIHQGNTNKKRAESRNQSFGGETHEGGAKQSRTGRVGKGGAPR
jgi:hypothetical protein